MKIKDENNNGFAIAIAWPETYCKQPGSWYDNILSFLRINKHHYYKAGHAALVLIDKKNAECHYFDFGRYHAPFQHGRVRSAKTDHELQMKTIPIISTGNEIIVNYMEILYELQHNQACHGEGKLFASYCPVNFKLAFEKANRMQQDGPIPYGPFRSKGSNCSKFVNTAILAGRPDKKYTTRLKYLVPLTPIPLNNVNSLDHKIVIPKQLNEHSFHPQPIENKEILKTTLFQPNRHQNIPENAQWLSGEGAGSWFHIVREENLFHIKRLSPDGKIECDELFEIKSNVQFDAYKPFKITYPSNCELITILQNENKIKFILNSELVNLSKEKA